MVYLYKHCPNGLTKSWENKEQHLDDLFLESSGENGAAEVVNCNNRGGILMYIGTFHWEETVTM